MTQTQDPDDLSVKSQADQRISSLQDEKLKLHMHTFKEKWKQKAEDDDTLVMCLEFLARFYDRPASPAMLKSGLPLEKNKLTPDLFVRAAEKVGLSSKIIRKNLSDISSLTLPCVLILEGTKACLLVSRTSDGTFEVIFPETGSGSKTLLLDDLKKIYSGYAIFSHPLYRYDERSADIAVTPPKSWFFGTLGQFWSIYSQVGIAAILINIFAVASPLFVMTVYDRVIPNNATDTLWVLTIGVLIVFMFDLLLKTLRVYYVDMAGRNADILLASHLFQSVLDIRLAHRPSSSGGFANQLREFETLREFFSSASLVALIDLPFVFLFILVIFLAGGALAWVPLLTIPLLVVSTLFLQAPLRSWINRFFREGSQKHALLVETIYGLETIKSFTAEGRMQRNWENFVSQSASSANAVRFFGSLAMNIAGFIQQISYVILIIVGVYLISLGELSMGGLIACSLLSSRVMAPLSQVVGLLSKLHQSMSALKALNNIVNLPKEREEGKTYLYRPHLEGNIEFQGVSFTYPDQKMKALTHLSLTVKAGEKVGIVGRIGSGKSTLAKLLLNLYGPEEGNIFIDGTDVRQIDPADLRHNIGYIPQDIYLFYGNVRENIMLGARPVSEEEFLKVSILSGVHEFVRQHPMGYDMVIEEGGASLSGGQRQSIAVARALIRDPSIVLLDEPSAMLDQISESQLIQRLSGLLQGKTAFIISHRMSILDLVDRVLVMDKGTIVADGPKADVLRALSHAQIRSAG